MGGGTCCGDVCMIFGNVGKLERPIPLLELHELSSEISGGGLVELLRSEMLLSWDVTVRHSVSSELGGVATGRETLETCCPGTLTVIC